jgi:hypothetical protein
MMAVSEVEIDTSSGGVYVGYRAWRCGPEHDKSGRLIVRSAGLRGYWRQAKIEAHCDYCVEEPPNINCTCGIYALKDPKKVVGKALTKGEEWIFNQSGRTYFYIFGSVVLWGRVIEGDDGYRAQYARMDTLVIPAPDVVPTHVKVSKTWVPIELDLGKLALELMISYGVPVVQDTESIYYWTLPGPDSESHIGSGTTKGGRKAGVPQYDTKTGKLYRSRAAVGKAWAREYGLNPDDHFVWYQIIHVDPMRFRNATAGEISDYNKANPWNLLGR